VADDHELWERIRSHDAKSCDGEGQVSVDKSYFAFGKQEEGWFVFLLKPFAGAAGGTVQMNQVEFTLAGRPYFSSRPIQCCSGAQKFA
jgi:hypothetical protein